MDDKPAPAPDPVLIKRVVQAMVDAAAKNFADSPETALEAMARAAVEEIRAEDAKR